MFSIPVSLRWADIDANYHLRHSVYYDLGATCRIAFLSDRGLTMRAMEELGIGPVIFREEAVFRKEVRMGDELTISLAVSKMRRDGARFSFRHELKKTDGTLCAVMNLDGAWIDTKLRKLTTPPDSVRIAFEDSPRTTDFEWLPG